MAKHKFRKSKSLKKNKKFTRKHNIIKKRKTKSKASKKGGTGSKDDYEDPMQIDHSHLYDPELTIDEGQQDASASSSGAAEESASASSSGAAEQDASASSSGAAEESASASSSGAAEQDKYKPSLENKERAWGDYFDEKAHILDAQIAAEEKEEKEAKIKKLIMNKLRRQGFNKKEQLAGMLWAISQGIDESDIDSNMNTIKDYIGAIEASKGMDVIKDNMVKEYENKQREEMKLEENLKIIDDLGLSFISSTGRYPVYYVEQYHHLWNQWNKAKEEKLKLEKLIKKTFGGKKRFK